MSPDDILPFRGRYIAFRSDSIGITSQLLLLRSGIEDIKVGFIEEYSEMWAANSRESAYGIIFLVDRQQKYGDVCRPLFRATLQRDNIWVRLLTTEELIELYRIVFIDEIGTIGLYSKIMQPVRRTDLEKQIQAGRVVKIA